jgi:hypothetical protein
MAVKARQEEIRAPRACGARPDPKYFNRPQYRPRNMTIGTKMSAWMSLFPSARRDHGGAVMPTRKNQPGPGAESLQSRAEVMSGRALKTIPLTAPETN